MDALTVFVLVLSPIGAIIAVLFLYTGVRRSPKEFPSGPVGMGAVVLLYAFVGAIMHIVFVPAAIIWAACWGAGKLFMMALR